MNDNDTNDKKWTSTVDYEFGVSSFWIDDRDRGNPHSMANRYDCCVTYVGTKDAGYWTLSETQWRRIE